MRAVATGGLDAVRVDPLARQLGVTRGSFYWHFADREALLKATLDCWEARSAERFKQRFEGPTDPAERLERGIRRGLGDEIRPRLLPALLARSDHPLVKPVLRRFIKTRTDIAVEACQALGLTPEAARRRALVSFAVYLGWLDLHCGLAENLPELDGGPDAAAFIDEVVRLLLPERPMPGTP